MVLCSSRDVTVLKQFDESEIFWHLLFLLAEGDFFFKIIYIQDQFYKSFKTVQKRCDINIPNLWLSDYQIAFCTPKFSGDHQPLADRRIRIPPPPHPHSFGAGYALLFSIRFVFHFSSSCSTKLSTNHTWLILVNSQILGTMQGA
jgi:hypothetical protein